MLDHQVPMDWALASEWLIPAREEHPERYEHMREYVLKVCPDFVGVIAR
jgi:hypothetical protein